MMKKYIKKIIDLGIIATFQSKYVKVQDADLSYVDVKCKVDNNY